MSNKIRPFKFWPQLVYMPEEIQVYINSTKRSLFAYIISILATIFLVINHAPMSILLIWIAVHASYIIVRIYEYKALQNDFISGNKNIDTLVSHNILLMGVGGFLWGTSPWLAIVFAQDSQFIYYILAITFGVSAGAIATISALYMGFVFFVSALLLMQISALLYLAESTSLLLALLSFIFLIVILISGKTMHKVLRRNFVMAKRLKISQKNLDHLNSSLQKQVNAQVFELGEAYYHDSLTGLENLFRCHEEIEASPDNYLLLLDLSDFGDINKCFGKEFADTVLVHFSRSLSANIQSNMKLYRGESDRFIIYVKGSNEDQLKSFAQAQSAFYDIQEIEVQQESLHLSFNIGIAKIESVLNVLISCELALEDSKKLGSKQFSFFKEEKDSKYAHLKNTRMTKFMIEEDEIFPYYQAIKDIKQDKIVKYEVLARGRYEGGIKVPISFLESAKRLGLLPTISRVMMSKSFAFFEDKDFSFSINITEQDLMSPYLLPYVENKLLEHNIQASRVTFEVLENVDITDRESRVVKSLKALHTLGCEIAVDDFGVANSSFLRFLELEFDYLKLDGVFIRGLEHSQKQREVVGGIVKMAQAMKIKTVAEFVENDEVYEVLRELGVDYAQGYGIHKPSPTLSDS